MLDKARRSRWEKMVVVDGEKGDENWLHDIYGDIGFSFSPSCSYV